MRLVGRQEIKQQVTVERGQGPCVACRSAKGRSFAEQNATLYVAPQHVTTETHNLNHAGEPADGAIEGAAAICIDLGPNFGLSGPSVGGAVGHIISRANWRWPRHHARLTEPVSLAGPSG
jgi:hypothetical protein